MDLTTCCESLEQICWKVDDIIGQQNNCWALPDGLAVRLLPCILYSDLKLRTVTSAQLHGRVLSFIVIIMTYTLDLKHKM